jgi:hypothetical protein
VKLVLDLKMGDEHGVKGVVTFADKVGHINIFDSVCRFDLDNVLSKPVLDCMSARQCPDLATFAGQRAARL